MRPARPLVLALAVALTLPAAALAQTTPSPAPTPTTAAPAVPNPLTLQAALQLAVSRGPDLIAAQTELANAQADLRAREADPSSLVATLQSARNAVALATVKLAATRLSVTQSVTSAFTALYEGQENVKLLSAQADLNSRNLDVARAKLAAQNGTALDVAKAENTLATSRQSLADAQAQLPILAARLAPLLGLPSTTSMTASPPPALQARSLDPAALEANLTARLATVVSARQALEVAQLNVRLADNDYTPAATLRDAKVALENATRSLDTASTSALTSLRDAVRAAGDALEQVSIRTRDVANAQTTLTQAQARLAGGTATALDVRSAEVALQQARYQLAVSQDAYLRALATLAVSSGMDTTGLAGAGT